MKNKKYLIVITGASGSGKSSIAKILKDEMNIVPVITHTTREIRKNEKEGRDYYFENKASFEKLNLLEKVKYGENCYGSSMEGLDRAWKESDLISIVLDTKGALTYYEKVPNSIVIYLKVPNKSILKQRLIDRGDYIEKINQRINSDEFHRDATFPEYLKDKAIVVTNDDLNKTFKKIKKIILNEID